MVISAKYRLNAEPKGGKAKGHAYTEKREQAVALKAEGLSYTQIAEQLKVARRSVINWCK